MQPVNDGTACRVRSTCKQVAARVAHHEGGRVHIGKCVAASLKKPQNGLANEPLKQTCRITTVKCTQLPQRRCISNKWYAYEIISLAVDDMGCSMGVSQIAQLLYR